MRGMKAEELARILSAKIEGDGGAVVSGVASPEEAEETDLIYVETAKHQERAEVSRARCAIVAEGMHLKNKTTLAVKQPKAAFARAAEHLLEEEAIAEGIHATAVIDRTARLGVDVGVGPYAVIEADAVIGARTQIGAFGFVGRGVRIGESCRISPRVTLYANAKLGSRVRVHSGTVIGGDGFGYVYDDGEYRKFPQAGKVEIGDDVEIGSNAAIARGSLGRTCIGRGTKLDNMVHVAHNVEIGEHTIIAAQTGISGSCKIGDRVVMGGQVGVGDHCTIESGSVIGGQAGILTGKKIRAGQTMWGTPARPLEKFKRQHAVFEQLPELAKRLRRVEERG